MRNKEKVQNKIEQVNNSINNLKSSAYGGRNFEFEEKFERLTNLMEDLSNLIDMEDGGTSNRNYQGL